MWVLLSFLFFAVARLVLGKYLIKTEIHLSSCWGLQELVVDVEIPDRRFRFRVASTMSCRHFHRLPRSCRQFSKMAVIVTFSRWPSLPRFQGGRHRHFSRWLSSSLFQNGRRRDTISVLCSHRYCWQMSSDRSKTALAYSGDLSELIETTSPMIWVTSHFDLTWEKASSGCFHLPASS